jgi:MFS family permease
MGLSTTLIGFVPGYDSIGSLAPILLCVLRFGQGIGLGGEWGGAALLAIENAPADKRGWFGMFPQLGPSIGFLASNGLFFALALSLSDEQFRSWGWRVPFIVSAVLVVLGLYVRLKIAETPAFQAAIERKERVKVPIATLLSQHWLPSARSRWWSATRCSTTRPRSRCHMACPCCTFRGRRSSACCASRWCSWRSPHRCRHARATASDASRC